jgi:hypothetical protein
VIDAAVLLKDLQRQLRLLEDDLRGRTESEAELRDALQAEHRAALEVGRTAATYGGWRDERVTQAAVAWLLGCVFVRFAEDNGLVDVLHLAGTGERARRAADAQTHYFEQHPSHSDREWLTEAFRALAAHPAAAPLFDARHNPLWQLPISVDAATELLDFWRRRDAETGLLVHDFTDEAWGTRFLGDLYQDMSEAARKAYALLQTPDFVEEFLLDRTLEPAVADRGLEGLRMIDPTCGSGHFLLGGFARLLAHWRAQEPGTDERTLVQRALDGVYGIDVNPFAVAIARFRLTVEALRESGLRRLADAPAYRLHLAVGDSLLHGRREGTFAGMDDASLRLADHAYATEDADLLREMLDSEHRYDVVVGNPPYITPKDRALSAAYRDRYGSCHREFALSVPFAERFFELARYDSDQVGPGHVGMITSNSFMKREFGKKLIEQLLPIWDLTHVLDTSGAYIPGHGTPTVILLGRRRRPVLDAVRVAMGVRGEPAAPDDPSRGLVWQALLSQVDDPDSDSPFLSVVDMPRNRLMSHPWSLAGGGAAGLLDSIEDSAAGRIADRGRAGSTMISGEDEALLLPASLVRRLGLRPVVPVVLGDGIRDWTSQCPHRALRPYDSDWELLSEGEVPRLVKFLWGWRTLLWQRKRFSISLKTRGATWYEWRELYAQKLDTPLSIAWGEVATHNRFVLDHGGKVFKQTAPVIKLPPGATEDDHLGLLGALNSSTACFWLKQVCQGKGNGGVNEGYRGDAWEQFFQFNGTNVERLPLPGTLPLARTRRVEDLAQRLTESDPRSAITETAPTRDRLDELAVGHARAWAEMIALQEELDWECYRLYGVLEKDLTAPEDAVPPLALGERAFEIVLARQVEAGEASTEWFARHRSTPCTKLPEHWPAAYREVVERRIALIESNRDLALIERPECKRRWQSEPWEDRERRALRDWLLDRLEARELWLVDAGAGPQPVVRSVAELADALRADAEFLDVLALYTGRPDADLVVEVGKIVADEHVPYLAALRYSDAGLRKREDWERTWELQRAEDAGQDVGTIPVPPKYKDKDFARTSYWQARGKLDVPKERFISYPLAGRDADPTLLLGWAGWDHLQCAQALATVIVERREMDGWDCERLVPLLAGLAELEPWVLQWHPEIDPAYGMAPGAFYRSFLDDTLRECELTRDDPARWRPPAPTRGRPRKST